MIISLKEFWSGCTGDASRVEWLLSARRCTFFIFFVSERLDSLLRVMIWCEKSAPVKKILGANGCVVIPWPSASLGMGILTSACNLDL